MDTYKTQNLTRDLQLRIAYATRPIFILATGQAERSRGVLLILSRGKLDMSMCAPRYHHAKGLWAKLACLVPLRLRWPAASPRLPPSAGPTPPSALESTALPLEVFDLRALIYLPLGTFVRCPVRPAPITEQDVSPENYITPGQCLAYGTTPLRGWVWCVWWVWQGCVAEGGGICSVHVRGATRPGGRKLSEPSSGASVMRYGQDINLIKTRVKQPRRQRIPHLSRAP